MGTELRRNLYNRQTTVIIVIGTKGGGSGSDAEEGEGQKPTHRLLLRI